LAYLQRDHKTEIKLTCSHPNSSRTQDGASYYCIPREPVSFPCQEVDTQVINHLRQCEIAPQYLPAIRKAYAQDIAILFTYHKREEQMLERAMAKSKDKELNLWRAFTECGMHSEHYAKLAREYQDEQQRITVALLAIKEHNKDQITNLDTALDIIAQIGERFDKQSPARRRQILQHMVWKVVVNEEGCVLRLDFKPPFAYLQQWLEGGNGQGLHKENGQHQPSAEGEDDAQCSFHDS
jgi:hypothetical protein